MLRTPATFSFQDIDSWKSDVTNLPIDIKKHADILTTLAAEHARLTDQKDEIILNSLNPQQERVNAIQWKLAILENPGKIVIVKSQIVGFNKELATQNGALQELRTRIGNLREAISNFEAAETFVKCQADDTQLRGKLTHISGEIVQHTQKQLALAATLRQLRGRIDAANCELQRLNSVPTSGYSSTQTPSGGYTSSHHHQHPHHAEIQQLTATIQSLHSQIHINEDQACRNDDCINTLNRDLRSVEVRLAENQATETRIEGQLSRINFKIPSLNMIATTLAQARKDLAQLEWNEKRLIGEIKSNGQSLQALEQRDVYLTNELATSKTQLGAYIQKTLDGELQQLLASDAYTLDNVDALKTLYGKEKDILSRYANTRDQFLSSIKDNLKRQELENRMKLRCENQLQRCYENKFLSDFNGEDTAKLKIILDNLSQKIIAALQQYNKEHPRIDDPHIRGRLREYSSRIEFIVGGNRAARDTAQDLRQRIIHLSGYIWSLTESIDDKDFKQIVLDTLDKGAISQPDSTKQFVVFRENNQAQLYRITPEHLKASEAEDYRNAYTNLKALLDNQPKDMEYYVRYLFSTGNNLLKIVNDNNSSYDHSTKILNATRELLLDFKLPANHKALADLLKENQHGRRSTAKVVTGAIFMVLGAAAFAVCLTLGILSLGILSAPAAIGMVSSSALFGLGLTLCISGRNKGVHKAIMNFQWAAEKSDYKYAVSPLSKHAYFQKPSAPPLDASAPVFGK